MYLRLLFVCVLVSFPVLVLYFIFFFNDTATTEIYTLSLHDALPISALWLTRVPAGGHFATDLLPALLLCGVAGGLSAPSAQIGALSGVTHSMTGLASGLSKPCARSAARPTQRPADWRRRTRSTPRSG